MSLIQEALKRKQEELQKSGGVVPPIPRTSPPPPPLAQAPEASRGTGVKIAGVGLVVFLLLALAAGLLYLALQKSGAKISASQDGGGETAINVAASEPSTADEAKPAADVLQSLQKKVEGMKDAVLAEQEELAEVAAVVPASTPPMEPAPAGEPAVSAEPVAADAPQPTQSADATAHTRWKSTKAWPKITVNGVLANANQVKAAAIINQRVITVNEQVSGAVIVDIQPSGVTFEFEGETRFVGMGQTIE